MTRRNIRISAIVAISLIVVLGVLAKEYSGQKFMSLSEAKARWGAEVFEAKKFKSGNTKIKTSMSASLIESKELIGAPLSKVRETLGEYSGHYLNDEIPTYIIEEGWKTDNDTWQLVFLLDASKKVKEIKIHKNCCGT